MRNCATLGVHLTHFGPTSVQFKSEINGTFPCKRHQKQHLEFLTAFLRTRRQGVRIPPGAPFSPSLSVHCEHFSPGDESACDPKPMSFRQIGRNPFNVGHKDLANELKGMFRERRWCAFTSHWEGIAIGTVAQHGIESIGDGDDVCPRGICSPRKPRG
jgi:hypothetical protein